MIDTKVQNKKTWLILATLGGGIAASVGLCVGFVSDNYTHTDERRAIVGIVAASLSSTIWATALLMRVWHGRRHDNNNNGMRVPLWAWMLLVAGGVTITTLLRQYTIVSVRHDFADRGMDPQSSYVAIQWWVYLIFGLSPLLWGVAACVDYYHSADDDCQDAAAFTHLPDGNGSGGNRDGRYLD